MDEKKLTNQEIIALMDVYLTELNHRDNGLFIKAFRYFYAVIVVILLPYIPSITPILENNLFLNYKLFFHICGFIMSLIFGYVLWGYVFRQKAISLTYEKTYEKLPKEYQRISLNELSYGKFFKHPMTEIVIITMFLILLGINILLFLTTK
jgi:hypothetical protein